MALKTKAKAAKIGETLGKKPKEFTFIDPPMIDAPNTQILNLDGSPRQLPDPSKTLKPAMGIERVSFRNINKVDETDSNGEQVFKVDDNDRVRLVGSGWALDYGASQPGPFTVTVDDYAEVTFYGTGLNILSQADGSARDIRVTVDGGSEGANIQGTASNILNNRNYRMNQVIPATSGLTLGVHTVKIRCAAVAFTFSGIEILNDSVQIQIPQGELFAAGNKLSNSSLAAIDYNSGFEGNPTLNGKGGRVSVYMTPEGEIKKAIQQTDATQNTFLGTVDHSEEDSIGTFYPRDFGANRADDFSTLTTESNRSFTLDDGTNTLVCYQSRFSNDATDGAEYLSIGNISGAFITITFVGTGLDIELADVSLAYTGNHTITLDGVDLVTLQARATTWGAQGIKTFKIASGLRYGTHTLKIFGQSSGTIREGIRSYTVYGPKKPSIPSDAQEISEYYLTGDYVANTLGGLESIGQGLLRKQNIREMVYTGTWAFGAFNPTFYPNGNFLGGTSVSGYAEYTFFGTGFDWRMQLNTTHSADIDIEIDLHDGSGFQQLSETNFTIDHNGGGASGTGPAITTSAYGSPAIPVFTPSTGKINQDVTLTRNAGFEVSGLPVGMKTVRFTNNIAASMSLLSLDIITPIHFPNTKVGSLSMGPGVQLQKETASGGVDLGKAKAWLLFDQVANEIKSSYNIASVVDAATGVIVVYFEKPFKNENYIAVAQAGRKSTNGERLVSEETEGFNRTSGAIAFGIIVPSTLGKVDVDFINLAFFGELADEDEE